VHIFPGATSILQRTLTGIILMGKIVLVVKIPLRMQITTGEDTATEERESERESLNLARGLI
jgi:hypothetical protein